jgi:uncharacterized protein (TIGR03118 family)
MAGIGLAALGVAVGPLSLSSASDSPHTAANAFDQTNLVANKSSAGAMLTDPNLTNAWGLAASSSGPIWVSDNNSGKASVYSGGMSGSSVSLDLTVAVTGGNPTGQVYNSSLSLPPAQQAFQVGSTTGNPAEFIADSDSIGTSQSPGEITAWDGGSSFVTEDSPTGGPGGTTPAGAVFKGLAISTTAKAGPELYATDVANGAVDVFGGHFQPLATPTKFKDPAIPSNYVPFGIQLLKGKIYVTYGKQNAKKTDVVPGAGFGYVDVFTVNGVLVKHLVSGGSSSPLDEPWGLAIAPAKFGPFAGSLLVGNLGNGWINAFNPTTGAFVGTLDGAGGYPVTIPGLWALQAGNSAFGGSGTIIFSAGPTGYKNGLLGTLSPAK